MGKVGAAVVQMVGKTGVGLGEDSAASRSSLAPTTTFVLAAIHGSGAVRFKKMGAAMVWIAAPGVCC